MTSALLTGFTTGLLYGLMGFGIVTLFKTTGVANFAAGSIATLGATVALKVSEGSGVPVLVAAGIGVAATVGVGATAYWVVMRFRDDVDHLSLTVRTVGLFLLAQALLEKWLGPGQPFSFPRLLPRQSRRGVCHSNVRGDGFVTPPSVLPFTTLRPPRYVAHLRLTQEGGPP